MRRLYRRPVALAFVVATILMITAALIVGSDAPSSPARSRALSAVRLVSSPAVLVVTTRRCASGWVPRTAGRVVFRIADRTAHVGEIYLFNPYSGVTVAQAALDPATTSSISMVLKVGRYQWSCRLLGQPRLTSTVVTVGPAPVNGPAGPMVMIPVTTQEMAGAITSYRAYVTQELNEDSSQVQLLGTAIATGQLATARSAWLTAHLTWHRMGGAFDAFGNLGLSIDGTADRLQDGVTSAQFTGFHKVEMDLWQNDNLMEAASDTATLLGDVKELAVQFRSVAIPATELPLRTHEILEDALRDELSGDDDYGSGTDMASVEADVDGTRELLSLLAPLLSQRAPGLDSTVTSELNTLDTALAATQVNGQWVAVTAVPLAEREQVDGAIGGALETLDLVPELLQVVGSTT
jgi:iron uptake system EfeUOB component EfeO/EfeM